MNSFAFSPARPTALGVPTTIADDAPSTNASAKDFVAASDSAERLIQNAFSENTKPATNAESFFDIVPEPGFVIKLRFPKSKAFVNVCHSPHVPPPPPISAEEINKILFFNGENDDEMPKWRLPMSYAGPRKVLDKAGVQCGLCDVCVHSDVITMCSVDALFRKLVVQLAVKWANEKDKDGNLGDFNSEDGFEVTCLTKVKSMGGAKQLATHRVYRPKRPRITSIPPPKPTYYEDLDTRRLLLRVTVALPMATRASDIDVYVEERCVEVRHAQYAPLELSFVKRARLQHHSSKCDVTFDRNTRQLVITVPLSPS